MKALLFSALLCAALPLTVAAQAVQITALPVMIAWTDPNTPPTNAYRIYLDNAPIATATTTSFSISSLTPGAHTVAITAYDPAGESPKSNALSINYVSQQPIPSAPTTVRVIPTTVSIPPNTVITDLTGGRWTLSNNNVLLNGQSAGGGIGSQIWLVNGTIYVLGLDMNWYQWNPASSTYTGLGPTRPF